MQVLNASSLYKFSINVLICDTDMENHIYMKTMITDQYEPAYQYQQARKPRSYASPKLCSPTYSLTDRGKV